MNICCQDRGGWFREQQDSTGSPPIMSASKLLVAGIIGFSVLSGTGAAVDDLEKVKKAQSIGSTISSPSKVYAVESTHIRTAAENLLIIRTIFSPAISDLAKSFNVSRQTIYNWMNGEQPTSLHIDKLRNFAVAADIFADAGIIVNSSLLKRKIVGGKNLFEITQSGGSPADAAQLLVQIYKRESEQKERLSLRFADRRPLASSADSDIVAENDLV